MKKITIGVRDFALPVPRTGSIEVNSGYSAVPASGQELHVALQKKRQEEFYNYRSEVKVNHTFEPVSYTHLDVYKRQPYMYRPSNDCGQAIQSKCVMHVFQRGIYTDIGKNPTELTPHETMHRVA